MKHRELENYPTFIPVVAAAIVDAAGRLLLQQALANKRHAGLWEFPGGKVEIGETPRFALCREVMEELAIELDEDALVPAGFAEEAACDGRPAIVLFLYSSLRWRGAPEAREGQAWGWFTREEAGRLPMAAMDHALLQGLGSTRPA